MKNYPISNVPTVRNNRIFVNVKSLTLISLLGAFFLLTACPGTNQKSHLEQVQENNMDFPDLRTRYYQPLEIQLSQLFDKDYALEYALQDNAVGYVIYEMDVYFCIEEFDEEEAETIRFSFDDENITAFDAVHDYYLLKRQESLSEPDLGIKKELPKSVNFPGYVQVITGVKSDYEVASTYFTATLEINGKYYVFQMIGKEENMGYLYDDFIDILSSVHL